VYKKDEPMELERKQKEREREIESDEEEGRSDFAAMFDS